MKTPCANISFIHECLLFIFTTAEGKCSKQFLTTASSLFHYEYDTYFFVDNFSEHNKEKRRGNVQLFNKLMLFNLSQYLYTVYPRMFDPFYIVSYIIKWDFLDSSFMDVTCHISRAIGLIIGKFTNNQRKKKNIMMKKS